MEPTSLRLESFWSTTGNKITKLLPWLKDYVKWKHGRLARWSEWSGSSPKFLIEIQNCVFVFYVISSQNMLATITCEATRSWHSQNTQEEGVAFSFPAQQVCRTLSFSHITSFFSLALCEVQMLPWRNLVFQPSLNLCLYTAVVMAASSRLQCCLSAFCIIPAKLAKCFSSDFKILVLTVAISWWQKDVVVYVLIHSYSLVRLN